MLEIKKMRDYRDYYMFDFEQEKIVFLAKDGVEGVKEYYEKCIKALCGNEEITTWHFDVALSLLKNLSDEDIDYMEKHPSTSEYHRGFGTHIRNRYVYPSKKVRDYIFADDESTKIIHILLTMVHPKYDLRNEALTSYYNSYLTNLCSELYYEKYKECFDEVEDELIAKRSSEETINNPFKLLKDKILSRIGRRGFLESIDYAYEKVKEQEEYHKEHNKGKRRIEEFMYRLSFYVPLHPLEHNQLKALVHIGVFIPLNMPDVEPVSTVTEFINQNLNLKDEDRDFMIECVLKIQSLFNPHERY